jgi:hypothetical protein
MADGNSVKQEMESSGNMHTVTMQTLREAIGAGKLGFHVRTKISKPLGSRRFLHCLRSIATFLVLLLSPAPLPGQFVVTANTNDADIFDFNGDNQGDLVWSASGAIIIVASR